MLSYLTLKDFIYLWIYSFIYTIYNLFKPLPSEVGNTNYVNCKYFSNNTGQRLPYKWRTL